MVNSEGVLRNELGVSRNSPTFRFPMNNGEPWSYLEFPNHLDFFFGTAEADEDGDVAMIDEP